MTLRLLDRLFVGNFRLLRAPGAPGTTMMRQRRKFSSPAPPSGSPTGGVTGAVGHPEKKEVSKHIGFYKEFGRPISKVFLMAFFAYQAFYWIWLKLEKEEIQREKEKEVAGLMAEVERLRTK